jgi:ATPase subunit of ABC transporter with duplicated ATPase domains
LILDEPTNNMDSNGLDYLQNFIATTEQTCIVISHDEAFLNSFTDMVLYLDIHSKKVESYMGDYYYVKNEISKRIQKENAENLRKQQKALQKKEQANKFANKGGNLRKIAKTMRQVAADMEESIIEVRREDISLSNFVIPFTQPTEFNGKLMSISHISGYNQCIPLKSGTIQVRKGSKIHLCGPNGIGKSTFLEGIVSRTAPGVIFESSSGSGNKNDDCRIGYYRQDFYNFDFSKTVMQWMEQVSNHQHSNGELYQIAAKFLLRGTNIMKQPIGTLSEGQKGLLSFACLYILEPTILIVDEPTNHINFRHIPAITYALSHFDGALIIVSHDQDFIKEIGPFETVIDMGKEFENAATSAKSAVAV